VVLTSSILKAAVLDRRLATNPCGRSSCCWPDSDDRTRAAVDEVLGASVHSACTEPLAEG
jgi:hypothetical protein